MSVKAGQVLHDSEGFVIDRIQTAGVGNLNIPEEKIYELGNYETVATVRDIPDLSFDVESFDVTCEFEALIVNQDPSTLPTNYEINFDQYVPLNIISPFKSSQGNFDIVKGIAVPYLTLERSSYRFGVGTNSTQQHTLRGDSVFYIQGTPYQDIYGPASVTQALDTITTGANAVYTFENTAQIYNYAGDAYYALDITAKVAGTNTYRRLYFGEDYTNTATAVTIIPNLSSLGFDTLVITYGSTTAASYAQTVHEAVSSTSPAAIRGKDVDVFIGTDAATPVFTRWSGIQSFEVTRSVNIENDEELGNSRFVAQEYDTADVTGSITVKPLDPADLWEKIAQVANVPVNEVAGPLTSVPLPIEIRVTDPDTGNNLKTFYIPDARFTIPGVQGRIQTKLEVTFNFTSDAGTLRVFNGIRP